jgi:hypothetical protein
LSDHPKVMKKTLSKNHTTIIINPHLWTQAVQIIFGEDSNNNTNNLKRRNRNPNRKNGLLMILRLEKPLEEENSVMYILPEKRNQNILLLSKCCTKNNSSSQMLSISWEGKLRFSHIWNIKIFWECLGSSGMRRKFILSLNTHQEENSTKILKNRYFLKWFTP